ncbi:MAG: hypothetical protein K2I66_06570, partial [Bacteroidales bacterium]|nr:hypothetical protein [Bacteroidales bacterium]
AYEAHSTFDCGLSPVCLSAPDLHYSCCKDIIKGRDAESAHVYYRTLKLEYAIRVWLRAALVSAHNPGPLLYYWWLGYQDNETSFREIQYHNFYAKTTPEEQVAGFWKLLEEIADSGEVKVSEGYSYKAKNMGAYFGFVVVLDKESAKEVTEEVKDVFTHPYNLTPRTYSWRDIKDLFVQLTLKQLSLVNPAKLHKHTKIDEMLFISCGQLDWEGVKNAVRMGANVNALDDEGCSALQHTLRFFMDHGKMVDKEYTEEENQAIKDENYEKCVRIVDYLLDLGADIDLFGMGGMQPLAEAYYAGSLEMVRHLLERGANPNYNSYREDDLSFGRDEDTRCTILSVIDDCLIEEYDDYEQSVEKLIREYGGRLMSWDLDYERGEHLGKYYLFLSPKDEKYLFFDNSGWGIGDENGITIENAEGLQTKITLEKVDGLKEWRQEYHQNLNERTLFDWNAWNRRGYALAQQVADILPDNVALFYPYGDSITRKYDDYNHCRYIETLRAKVRIYPHHKSLL